MLRTVIIVSPPFSSVLASVLKCLLLFVDILVEVPDAVSAKFKLAILPLSKFVSKGAVLTFLINGLVVWQWGIVFNMPPAASYVFMIEGNYLFCRVELDLGNVEVFSAVAFERGCRYDGPAVVFCFCRLSHN